DALLAAGCLDVHEEDASGARTARPELAAALRACRERDILTVWKLDRLGRSMVHLVEIVEGLHKRGEGLQVLTGLPIDTTTPPGRWDARSIPCTRRWHRLRLQASETTIAAAALKVSRGAEYR